MMTNGLVQGENFKEKITFFYIFILINKFLFINSANNKQFISMRTKLEKMKNKKKKKRKKQSKKYKYNLIIYI